VALRKNAKVELLKNVPLFSACSRRELEQLAQAADEIDLPAGTELTRESDTGREFVVIVEGEADVKRRGRRISRLSAGDFVGEIALLTGSPRTATVTATTPVRALVLTDRAFRALLADSPAIAPKLLAALAERLAPAAI
jgi:CRP-like cAMP-binding protein